MVGDQDMQMIQAFKEMGPLLDQYIRSKDDERDTKKQKKQHQDPDTGPHAARLLRLMGTMLIRLDADQQLMRKQDSWIFYMQTEPNALLPNLVAQAQSWHTEVKTKKGQPDQMDNVMPLRQHLMKHTALLLRDRVQKLAQVTDMEQDQLWKTSVKHQLIQPDGSFPFQRWRPQQQALMPTKQAAVPLKRMLAYTVQLCELVEDAEVIVKFHALSKAEQIPTVPWLLQISMREDGLQTLLMTLQGSTVWGLLGASLKPHTLSQSKQGQQLKELLGKGKGKKGHPAMGKGKQS